MLKIVEKKGNAVSLRVPVLLSYIPSAPLLIFLHNVTLQYTDVCGIFQIWEVRK
jgi:hypothetical protein